MENELYKWIRYLITEFNIDGLRIDTVPEVPKWFWKNFTETAGVYTVGEVFYPDWEFVASYVG